MTDEIISNETRLTRIQALVVEILNDLLRTPLEQTDRAISEAIERLGSYCVRDRSYVFVIDGEVTSNTHEWCSDGIPPMIDHLQGLPIALYGPIADHILAGEPYHVPDVSALDPETHARQLLESQEIRSILLVPMRWNDRTYGFIGFDGVFNTHAFLPGEVYLLQSVADVICSVLVRRDRDTAARVAQEALDAERAFLASILATSAMGIVVLDGEGVIRFVNDAAETILSTPRAALTDAGHAETILAQARIQDLSLFDQVTATGTPSVIDSFALPGDGPARFCSVHAAPVVGGGETSARVVYALVDVTEQVMADTAREAALEEARRANTAKSNFLAKMSHEMRTPLNGVLGVAEMLEKLVTDADQRRMVKIMHDSGALLLNIINDLLDMSKIEADLLEIESVPFQPSDIAQRLESVHTLKTSEKGISFGVSIQGDGGAPRLGDPHRLLQILHNILSNAIKFTESGSVNVEVDCRDPATLKLVVRDTGIGMSGDQLSYVFEEFGQADSTIARRFGGTGLGMPIVRRLVDMMDGTITLDSTLGEGTTVTVDLPAPPTEREEIAIVAQRPETARADLVGVRVLAADDNRTNRMILAAMMAQLGLVAVLAQNGQEALDHFDAEAFDAVILDISMPDLDGVKVLHEIRAREAATHGAEPRSDRLPMVAFTANAMSHQVAGYMEAGFDDCLTKPLQLERLRESLSALIAERGRRSRGPRRRSSAAT